MALRLKLLEFLADGRFHSGEFIGARLGVTRAAVWKRLQQLRSIGVEIQSVRGRGYRLAQPLDLMREERLRDLLSPVARTCITHIDLLTEVDSTNTYLKHLAREGAPSGSVCMAESQHAGRGRLGRNWVSPFACNLYLSLLWRFGGGPSALGGLSLVTGVALVRALQMFLSDGLAVKWPNDIQWHGHKLAGVLVEMAGEASGPSHAVIGLGVNVRMPDHIGDRISQPWTDMTRCMGITPSRNALAAAILNVLVEDLLRFEADGLHPFLDLWRRYDAAAGKVVQLHLPNGVIDGHACGIDDSGALLLQVGDELRRFDSGEISLRMSS